MDPSPLLGVDWSDWVIRLPRGDGPGGAATAFLVLAVIAYALVRGLVSIGDKITPIFWTLVTVAAVLAAVLVVASLQDEVDDPAGPLVEREIGRNECAEQLLSRCPALPQDPSG